MRQGLQIGRKGGEDGFTLLELIVLLAIIALAIVATVPYLERTRAGLGLRTSAHALAADLRAARTAARAKNAETALSVDLARRQYWSRGVAARQQLPHTLVMDLTVPEAERLGEALGRVRFFPDGTSSGGRILLKQEDRWATIVVDWLTGDVRVAWSR